MGHVSANEPPAAPRKHYHHGRYGRVLVGHRDNAGWFGPPELAARPPVIDDGYDRPSEPPLSPASCPLSSLAGWEVRRDNGGFRMLGTWHGGDTGLTCAD